jgi:hypothetical protein
MAVTVATVVATNVVTVATVVVTVLTMSIAPGAPESIGENV